MADDAASPWLTIAELADRLGVSDSTVRNWRRAYGDLIPETVGLDGVRRYSLARFEVVAVLRSRNLPAAEIRRSLAQTAESVPPADSATSFEAAVLARLDRLIEAVERIADHVAPKEDR